MATLLVGVCGSTAARQPGSCATAPCRHAKFVAATFFCQGARMAKRKSLTPTEQAEKFRDEAERRRKVGLPTIEEASAAVDAMIRQNIRDHGA